MGKQLSSRDGSAARRPCELSYNKLARRSMCAEKARLDVLRVHAGQRHLARALAGPSYLNGRALLGQQAIRTSGVA